MKVYGRFVSTMLNWPRGDRRLAAELPDAASVVELQADEHAVRRRQLDLARCAPEIDRGILVDRERGLRELGRPDGALELGRGPRRALVLGVSPAGNVVPQIKTVAGVHAVGRKRELQCGHCFNALPKLGPTMARGDANSISLVVPWSRHTVNESRQCVEQRSLVWRGRAGNAHSCARLPGSSTGATAS